MSHNPAPVTDLIEQNAPDSPMSNAEQEDGPEIPPQQQYVVQHPPQPHQQQPFPHLPAFQYQQIPHQQQPHQQQQQVPQQHAPLAPPFVQQAAQPHFVPGVAAYAYNAADLHACVSFLSVKTCDTDRYYPPTHPSYDALVLAMPKAPTSNGLENLEQAVIDGISEFETLRIKALKYVKRMMAKQGDVCEKKFIVKQYAERLAFMDNQHTKMVHINANAKKEKAQLEMDYLAAKMEYDKKLEALSMANYASQGHSSHPQAASYQPAAGYYPQHPAQRQAHQSAH